MNSIPFHKHLNSCELSERIKFYRLKSLHDYDTSLPHRHGYFEIFFFEQGSGQHLIDYQTIAIKEYSIHIVCPGQVHQLQLERMTKGCFLIFSEAFIAEHLQYTQILQLSFLQTNSLPSVLQLSNQDFDKYLTYTNEIEKAQDVNVQMAWLNIVFQKLKVAFESKSNFYAQTSKDEVLVRFKNLLEYHFTEEHLPSFYAEQIAITEKKLNQKIREVYGATTSEIIANRVLLEAKRLLINSSLSIKEIAFDLGFNDPAYFSRFVKKHTFKSPKELRDE